MLEVELQGRVGICAAGICSCTSEVEVGLLPSWLTGKNTICATIDPTFPTPPDTFMDRGMDGRLWGGGGSQALGGGLQMPLGCAHFSAEGSSRTEMNACVRMCPGKQKAASFCCTATHHSASRSIWQCSITPVKGQLRHEAFRQIVFL